MRTRRAPRIRRCLALSFIMVLPLLSWSTAIFAVALAEAGFQVIMPDAAEHGARYRGDEQGRMQRFWPILMNNFIEFPALQEAIRDRGWLADDRLAVAGASMGGMTAWGL